MYFLRTWLPVVQFLNLAALPCFIFSTLYYRKKVIKYVGEYNSLAMKVGIADQLKEKPLTLTDIDFSKIDRISIEGNKTRYTAWVYHPEDGWKSSYFFESYSLAGLLQSIKTYVDSLPAKDKVHTQ